MFAKQLPRVYLTINSTVRDVVVSIVRSVSSPPRTNDLTRPPAVVTGNERKGGAPVVQSFHVVIGVFHSVVASRRKLSLCIYVIIIFRGEGADVFIIMHGRSHMTIYPRIPTIQCLDGAYRVLTDHADIASAAPTANRYEVFGESKKA